MFKFDNVLSSILQLSKDPIKNYNLLREYILDVVTTHKPSGNPMEEHNIYFLFNALLKIDDKLPKDEYQKIHDWAIKIADAQIRTFNEGFKTMNNFQSHRIHIVANIGRTYNHATFLDWAHTHFLKQIENNLHPDGNSLDFIERDSLTYHVFNLQALRFALENLNVHNPTFDYYNYKSPSGSSIQQSVRFLIPYIQGKLQNYMFVNSKFLSDKTTIHVKEYNKQWSKENARNLLYLCMKYDPALEQIYKANYN